MQMDDSQSRVIYDCFICILRELICKRSCRVPIVPAQLRAL